MKAFLILEDGTVFEGVHMGAKRTVISEIVFNTSMAGYLEVLTDPSYAGQAVCMTYPLIGNYGVCTEDMESRRPWADALIARELSRSYSNFRGELSIQDFLEKNDVPAITGIDTRALVRLLRDKGTMNGMVTCDEDFSVDEVKAKLKEYTTSGAVKRTTCDKKYIFEYSEKNRPGKKVPLSGKGLRIALLDLGAKANIAYSLARRGCEVTVYPAHTTADELLADKPDGIMLSNGPGDPKECTSVIEEIKKLCASDVPIFAICLGHQLTALAHGGDTHKMKYGHRGGNHPVMELATKRVYITSQNHGYVVDTASLPEGVAQPAFVNVNDGTNEGLLYIGKKIYTVQFHPEACPGPQDSGYLFDRFIDMIKG